MQVKRSGFFMNVAYHFWRREDRPKKVNICHLFWRFVQHFLILIPFIYCIAGVVLGLCYAVGFLFCYKPNLSGKSINNFITYEKWPTTRKGHRIWPISVITTIGILSCAVYWQVFIAIDNFLNRYLGRSCYLYLPLIGAFAIWLLYRAIKKTEFWKILVAYAQAKKEKLCFMVDVV